MFILQNSLRASALPTYPISGKGEGNRSINLHLAKLQTHTPKTVSNISTPFNPLRKIYAHWMMFSFIDYHNCSIIWLHLEIFFLLLKNKAYNP